MPTPLWLTGFEYGVATLTTNGGGLCDSISLSAGASATIQNTIKRTGNYALHLSKTSGAANCRIEKSVTGATVIVGSFYVYYDTFPGTDNDDVCYVAVSSGVALGLKIDYTTYKLYARFWGVQDGNIADLALSADTWYRVDFRFDVSTNPSKIEFSVTPDGGGKTVFASPSTYAQAATTFTNFGLGATISNNYDFYFDDVIVTGTGSDYPIGRVDIIGIRPNSDGTHNAGTNCIEDNDGNDIGVVTAYDHVNSLPIGDTATYIRQVSTGTGNYAEVNFGDTSQTGIQGAIALLAYRSSDVTANEGGCIVIDEDSTETTVWGNPTTRADYSETDVFYKSAVLPAPSGGWDTGAVNALRARMGYSGNVASYPYWVDMIIEVGYKPLISPMPVRLTGFEHGTISANGGGLFDGVASTPSCTSTYKRTGTYSLWIGAVDEQISVMWLNMSENVFVGRFYFMFPTLPSAYFDFFLLQPNAGNYAVFTYVNADSKVKFRWGGQAGDLVDVVLSVNTWYRCDFRVIWNTNPRTIEWKIDGTAGITQEYSETGSTGKNFHMGTPSLQTGAVCFDDVMLSATSDDYPLGAGQIVGLSPNGAGSSVPGTDVIEDDTGADVNDSTNPANVELDGLPLSDGTDYIKQVATGSGNYAEVVMADLSSAANINGVSGIISYKSSDVTANNGATVAIRSDSTELEIYGTSGTPLDMSETDMFYRSAILAPPSGGWTQTEVNALKVRVGHSTNVASVPYWENVLVEVDYVPTSAQDLYPSGIGSAETFGLAVLNPQELYPDEDISIGTWTDQGGGTTNLWDTINEIIPSDSDYSQSAVEPSNDTLIVGVTPGTDPGVHASHTIHYRYRKSVSSATSVNLTVYLMDGSTEIAYWTHTDIGTTWTTVVQTLTTEQAGNITNYANLRLKFIANEV